MPAAITGPSPRPWGRGTHRLLRMNTGPSPRPWGRAREAPFDCFHRRTIPTPVGKRTDLTWVLSKRPDHPHARGEEGPSLAGGVASVGPSPRPWGRGSSICFPSSRCRTIPTPVGKRPSRDSSFRHSSDHPHARGEERCPGGGTSRVYGPSPRPWGRVGAARGVRSIGRTIPTPVGKSMGATRAVPKRPDHPHARGEEASVRDRTHASTGPSPRPWGRGRGVPGRLFVVRTIPTPVGKSS